MTAHPASDAPAPLPAIPDACAARIGARRNSAPIAQRGGGETDAAAECGTLSTGISSRDSLRNRRDDWPTSGGMMDEHMLMRWILVVVVLLSACTKKNPRSCVDGVCSDESLPFCDVDGAIGGAEQTCIAVTCNPGEVAACRGDQAITCNGVGNDYDLVACPLGCDAATGGCKQCANNTQCGNPAPICDTSTNDCRRCRTDDECPSQVCDVESGSCVAEASVVYAAPQAIGPCVRTSPCSLSDAVNAAITATVTPTIRMLPGTYNSSLDISSPTAQRLAVVATGAMVVDPGTPAVSVTGGADVSIRGIRVVSKNAVKCGVANTTPTTLSIRESSITILNNLGGGGINVVRCTFHLETSDVSLGSSDLVGAVGDDGTFEADRVHMFGNAAPSLVAFGKHVTWTITNSLFEDVGFNLDNAVDAAPGTKITVAQSTMIFSNLGGALSQGCDLPASPNRLVQYENAIVAALGPFDSIHGSSCSFRSTLLSREAFSLSGTTIADPKFVDVVARDFHVQSTSLAIDAAVPSLLGLDSKVDLDGVARPQGAKSDLGGYERKP